MLTDPQSITIAGVNSGAANSLPAVEVAPKSTLYQNGDESLKLTVSHQDSGKRTRRMVRLDQRIVSANPLTTVNEYLTLGVYLVIDQPEYGFTSAMIDNAVQGLKSFLASATVVKVAEGQH